MIATDIAARGIDIPDIEIVINFDLPNVPESYVHRIGRTARAGADGKAIAFCAPDEHKQLWDIEKVIKMDIPVVEMEGLTQNLIPNFDKPTPRRRGGGANSKRGSGPRDNNSRNKSKTGKKSFKGGGNKTLKR